MKLIEKLPDPFRMESGERVSSAEDWRVRRDEIIELLLDQQYGTMPQAPDVVNATTGTWSPADEDRKQRTDRLEFTPNPDKPRTSFKLELTVTYPSDEAIAKRKAVAPQFDQEG